MTLDGAAYATVSAGGTRTDIAASYPGFGSGHGLSTNVTADDGEHQVCLTAINVGGGADRSLGCKIINAVHPVAPSVPQSVTATADVGEAEVTWAAPASDGGAPPTKYTVVASPGGRTVVVRGTARSAVVDSLAARTSYTFTVTATNVAGVSPAAVTATITTPNGIPAQTTAAPVSTSRYIRNIRTATATELSTMRAEGRADALANPSGHRYLILLDIGGQDEFDGGAVLSATTRFVSYADLLKCLKAYVAGYHSGQRAARPSRSRWAPTTTWTSRPRPARRGRPRSVNPLVQLCPAVRRHDCRRAPTTSSPASARGTRRPRAG